MKLNEEYKQISVNSFKDYSDLKGKVVDKVAFTDRGYTIRNRNLRTTG